MIVNNEVAGLIISIKLKLILISMLLNYCPVLTGQLLANTTAVSWFVNAEPDLAGYKIYYGKKSRTYTEVVDVGNVTLFEFKNLDSLANHYFAVTAYDSSNNESTFSEEVTIINDSTLLELNIEAMVVMGQTQLDIHFSEPVEQWTAENKSSYQIIPHVAIRGGILNGDSTTIHLVTGYHESNQDYLLKVRNVKAVAYGNPVDSTSSISYYIPEKNIDCDFKAQLIVPSDGATIFSPVLEHGQIYELTVSGTYNYAINIDPNAIADAEWAETTILGEPGWTNPENAHMELLVNGQDIDWGPYSINHTYSTEIIGNGLAVTFRLSDDYYPDNEGYLMVTVEKR